jgi:redox-sensing transcriptional repressor
MMNLPGPSLERLARLYTILSHLDSGAGAGTLRSSRELGALIGSADHTIRKDLSLLREGGFPGLGTEQGYDAEGVKKAIEACLGLSVPRPACLVGLGKLGEAILNREVWVEGVYSLVAGFDSSVNRIEIVKTSVPLYHAREIARIVREKKIQVGILALPPEAAQEIADKLVEGGIRGIISFAPVVLRVDNPKVIVRNIALAGELHVISAYLSNQGAQNEESL